MNEGNNQVDILGIKIDCLNFKQTLVRIKKFLKDKGQYFVITPNPEMCLEAEKDADFKKLLNQADMTLPDGIGLLWAAKWQAVCQKHPNLISRIYYALKGLLSIIFYPAYNKTVISERVSGVDMMKEICLNFPFKIFLLGAKLGIAEKVKVNFERQKNKSEIVGTFAGSPAKEEEKLIVDLINKSGAEILFVAFGAPAQEKWIAANLKKMPKIRLAMGIGGSFDFLAGDIKRAPLLFRKLGIEWLFRLFLQPQRIKRIYNAVIKFPIKVIRSF